MFVFIHLVYHGEIRASATARARVRSVASPSIARSRFLRRGNGVERRSRVPAAAVEADSERNASRAGKPGSETFDVKKKDRAFAARSWSFCRADLPARHERRPTVIQALHVQVPPPRRPPLRPRQARVIRPAIRPRAHRVPLTPHGRTPTATPPPTAAHPPPRPPP